MVTNNSQLGNRELLEQLLADCCLYLGVKDVILLVYTYLRQSFDTSNVSCLQTLKTKTQRGMYLMCDFPCQPLYWIRVQYHHPSKPTLIELYHVETGMRQHQISLTEVCFQPFMCGNKLVLRHRGALSIYAVPELTLLARIPTSETPSFVTLLEGIPDVALMCTMVWTDSHYRMNFCLFDLAKGCLHYERNHTDIECHPSNCFAIGDNKFITWRNGVMKIWAVISEKRKSGDWLRLIRTRVNYGLFGRSASVIYLRPHWIAALSFGYKRRTLLLWDMITDCISKEVACSPRFRFGPQINNEWFCTFEQREIHIRSTQTGEVKEKLSFADEVQNVQVLAGIEGNMKLGVTLKGGIVKICGNAT